MIPIAVIGAGLIGTGWAIVFARAGHEVTLYDPDSAAVENALVRIDQVLPELHSRQLLNESPDQVLGRIRRSNSLPHACDGVGYVQESGPERVESKRRIFAALDECTSDAILASSSSGITVSQFADELDSRERCIIAHPVNPPYLIPAVEIVPARWTASTTVKQTRALMDSVGQIPILLKREVDGFVLNRLQGALLHEAFRLVEDGVASPEDIDKTVRDGLGLRWSFMGPFETIDLNAQGGIEDYVAKLGPLYLKLAEQRGVPRPWGSTLVAQVEADRRKYLSDKDLVARTAWRDRRLMDLVAHKDAVGATDKSKNLAGDVEGKAS